MLVRMPSIEPSRLHARLSTAALLLVLAAPADAQPGDGPPPGPPPAPRDGAPIDVTGVWVSVVNEDWRWRMMTPPKGDYESVPLNQAGRELADQWDPEADIAAGDECKAYGAPAITRIPGRIRISWDDEDTLELEFDAGMQTRLLHFSPDGPAGQPSLQGHSVAEWQKQAQSRGLFSFTSGLGAAEPGGGGALAVTTTNLLPGYLRKNGVPYSADAVLTEYFDRFDLPNGQEWLLVTSVVEDPAYLNGRFIVSSHFKKEPNDANFDPTPCSAR